MRPRAFVRLGLFVAVGVGGVLTLSPTRGQVPADPPKTLPKEVLTPKPAPSPVVPAAAATALKKPAPFDRYPLSKADSFDELTRQLVFATRSGVEWLGRDGVHMPNGRFRPGINLALGRASDDDSFLRQATGAFALARAAKLTGEEKHAVRAAETILSLLAEAPKDTTGVRRPVQPSVICNRVASAAMLAMAIYELPQASAELVQCAEELCGFLKGNLTADGMVQATEPGEPTDAEGTHHIPGMTLSALAMSHRTAPAKWKAEALSRGYAFYRKQFRETPQPALVPWMTTAFAEAYLQSKEAAYAEFVCEMCDWLKKLQYESTDARRGPWRGGFPTVADGKVVSTPPTADTALYAMGFADACRMIRQMEKPDAARYDGYRLALTRALQFLATLQLMSANTTHFADGFQQFLVGAFLSSANGGNVRTDHTAWTVVAFGQYFLAGADR
ncbi:MAG TPA: hypothetical protein VM597_20130 [Gemmataceae bacterium]|jgi:hypothetical protein|nr:hypothetical protein [Gemmataceae bacterium]